MTGLRAVIAQLYRDVSAPAWAAPNLDGLADVLRDLSWLPEGPVRVAVPADAELTPAERQRLLAVLRRAEEQTRATARPVRVEPGSDGP